MKISSLIGKTAIAIFTFLIMGSACSTVNVEKCIQADGEWKYGYLAYVVDDRRDIKPGEVIKYFVTMNCWGIYDFTMSFTPKERFVLGSKEGRNIYYEEVQGENGTIEKQFLRPYELHYTITVNNLNNPGKTRTIQDVVIQPSYPSSRVGTVIGIPIHALPGEKLRMDFTIFAEEGFYQDYEWLGMSVQKDTYRRL